MASTVWVSIILGVATAPPAAPQPDVDNLAKVVRTLLVDNLPNPVSQSNHGWGNQREVVIGLSWDRLRPRPLKSLRNDGHWQRGSIEVIEPKRTLAVGISKLEYPTPGVATFEAMIGADVRLNYEQQVWKAGNRIYGGETRATCRGALRLVCEVSNRFEAQPGGILPDAIFKVKITEAELFYTNLEVEKTLGREGEQAKRFGEIMLRFLQLVKPSVEKDILNKANAAVVKAAHNKEVRIELDRLFRSAKPANRND